MFMVEIIEKNVQQDEGVSSKFICVSMTCSVLSL